MNETSRVAVYIDFDNVVISRYDDVHGAGHWRRDDARRHAPGDGSDGEVSQRLAEANVDLGAVIDYASSYGTVALVRAYADWSVTANAAYKHQLTDRAVDLVQLFATSGTKNGADIRLAIDAVEDLLRHSDITHVVIVGGDSDYIPLAQRCKRMGRFVAGIGVTGSTSRALVAALDAFSSYGDLPGVEDRPLTDVAAPAEDAPAAGVPATAQKKVATKKAAAKKTAAKKAADPEAPGSRAAGKKAAVAAATVPTFSSAATTRSEAPATALLRRAMQVGSGRDDGWQYSSSVKSQMQRLDSTFKEKSLGHSSFRDFIEAHTSLVDTKVLDNGQLLVRLR
ncbi:NYN domain-containing protein [Knoellia locipacati]|uniref:HTH OST-type domain-containing protein n=1 Tax=Knoellia locipacati TaxID=882824 RepID=A0A512SY31_9MICO|nr:NYN domain-containing protein [Knoellia locipacati]GEQ12859.1 hypothetical protein KLO01_09060 [Knoellia locipacati]